MLGLDFHTQQAVAFQEVINDLYALTPNYDEAKLLTAVDEPENVLKTWATLSTADLFLKGGHRSQKIGQDQLFVEGERNMFLTQSVPMLVKNMALAVCFPQLLQLGWQKDTHFTRHV